MFVICFICVAQANAGVLKDITENAVRDLPGGNIIAGTVLKPKPQSQQTNALPLADIRPQLANIQASELQSGHQSLVGLLGEYSSELLKSRNENNNLVKQLLDERESHKGTKDSLESALNDSGVPYSGMIAIVSSLLIPLIASLVANLKFVKKHPELVRVAKQLARQAFKAADQELQNQAAKSKDGNANQSIADARNALNVKALDVNDEIEEKLAKAK